MIKIFEKLLSLLYVQPCYFCRSTKDDALLCAKCHSKIHFMPPAVFKNINGVCVYACALYDGYIKTLVHDLKYHNKKRLSKVQAQIMFEYFNQLNLKEKYTIIPVPIHKNRQKERKYNQMDIVAKEFASYTKFPINQNLVYRTKDTKKQYNLHKKDRIENMKNAFAISQNQTMPKDTKLLVIDDVTSSGITLEELINTLKSNGYSDVTALTLATPDIWNTAQIQ